MLRNDLTPAQVCRLLELECTDAEKDEVRAAVRELTESVLACLTRGAGQDILHGLLLAEELQQVRGRFAGTLGRIVASARRRYLDRTLHGGAEAESVVDVSG